jgi:hypothetical protein
VNQDFPINHRLCNSTSCRLNQTACWATGQNYAEGPRRGADSPRSGHTRLWTRTDVCISMGTGIFQPGTINKSRLLSHYSPSRIHELRQPCNILLADAARRAVLPVLMTDVRYADDRSRNKFMLPVEIRPQYACLHIISICHFSPTLVDPMLTFPVHHSWLRLVVSRPPSPSRTSRTESCLEIDQFNTSLPRHVWR